MIELCFFVENEDFDWVERRVSYDGVFLGFKFYKDGISEYGDSMLVV